MQMANGRGRWQMADGRGQESDEEGACMLASGSGNGMGGGRQASDRQAGMKQQRSGQLGGRAAGAQNTHGQPHAHWHTRSHTNPVPPFPPSPPPPQDHYKLALGQINMCRNLIDRICHVRQQGGLFGAGQSCPARGRGCSEAAPKLGWLWRCRAGAAHFHDSRCRLAGAMRGRSASAVAGGRGGWEPPFADLAPKLYRYTAT